MGRNSDPLFIGSGLQAIGFPNEQGQGEVLLVLRESQEQLDHFRKLAAGEASCPELLGVSPMQDHSEGCVLVDYGALSLHQGLGLVGATGDEGGVKRRDVAVRKRRDCLR